VVLLAACGFVLVPTAGLAGQTTFVKLIELTGRGKANSSTFRIRSSSIQIAYNFSTCTGGSGGSFIVDLVGPVSHPYNHYYVNRTGTHGKGKVTRYPAPGKYHVSVDSTCHWTVTVFGR
jgi:hypothetical protein